MLRILTLGGFNSERANSFRQSALAFCLEVRMCICFCQHNLKLSFTLAEQLGTFR